MTLAELSIRNMTTEVLKNYLARMRELQQLEQAEGLPTADVEKRINLIQTELYARLSSVQI